MTLLDQLVQRLSPGQKFEIVPHGTGRVNVMIGHQIVLGGETGVILSSLVADVTIDESPFQLPLIPPAE